MMWFDNNLSEDIKSISETLLGASLYYAKKYNRRPDTCHINPLYLLKDYILLYNIKLIKDKDILLKHIWIGVEDDNDPVSV